MEVDQVRPVGGATLTAGGTGNGAAQNPYAFHAGIKVPGSGLMHPSTPPTPTGTPTPATTPSTTSTPADAFARLVVTRLGYLPFPIFLRSLLRLPRLRRRRRG